MEARLEVARDHVRRDWQVRGRSRRALRSVRSLKKVTTDEYISRMERGHAVG